MIRALFDILVLIQILGCSAFTGISNEYPRNWAEVAKENDLCKNMSGEYKNHGIATYSRKGGSPFLAYRFGFDVSLVEELESIETIKIKCIDEKAIELLAISDNVPTLERKIVLNSVGIHFEDNTLIFPTIDESDADGFGGTLASSRFRLSVSSDGSLIGEERSVGIGLALWVVPIGGTQTFWFRWDRIESK